MDEKILDSFDEETRNNQVEIKSWISIVLLWIGIVLSINNGLLKELNTIIALCLLITATILTYNKKSLGIRFTFLIIILGLIGLIEFYPITYKIGISIGWFFLGFEAISLAIALIHYFTNLGELNWVFKDILKPSEETMREESRSRINGFKARFSSKSVEELEQIVKLNKLVPEAIQASKELISENKN